MGIAKQIFAKHVVDPCVPRGILPRRGVGRYLFRWALKGRDLYLDNRHPLYDIVHRPPFNSTYALTRGAMAWLWRYLQKVQPRTILEMGSGRSTGMFSLYARNQQHLGKLTPAVVSLEHDGEWFTQTATLLRDLGTDHLVHLMLAPIAGGTLQERGYGIDQSELRHALLGQKVDLLLIDGPPGKEVGRQNTLPLAMPLLADNADVFLDDAEREGESQIVARWQEQFGERLQHQGTFPFGFGFSWLKIRQA